MTAPKSNSLAERIGAVIHSAPTPAAPTITVTLSPRAHQRLQQLVKEHPGLTPGIFLAWLGEAMLVPLEPDIQVTVGEAIAFSLVERI